MEPYSDGAWYDAEYVHIRADVPLYRSIAREARGPILELAAGTGRLSFPMAQSGATLLATDGAERFARVGARFLDAPIEARAVEIVDLAPI